MEQDTGGADHGGAPAAAQKLKKAGSKDDVSNTDSHELKPTYVHVINIESLISSLFLFLSLMTRRRSG